MTPAELKATRARLGLSQPALARLLGVHPLTVSKWERGLHHIPKMVELALERPRMPPSTR